MQSDYPRNNKPNSSAFGKPFTYLPTLPPGTTPSAIIEQSAIVNPVAQKGQKPLPVPPVRSSSTVLSTVPNKEPSITQNGNGSIQNVLPKTGPKPRPPVPPRGETTRLTTVSKGPGFNNYVNTAPKTVESKLDSSTNSDFDLPVSSYAESVVESVQPKENRLVDNAFPEREHQRSNSVNSFNESDSKAHETLARKTSTVKSPEENKEKPARKPSFESGTGKISSELEAKFNKILQAQESQEKLSRNASQESDSSQKQVRENEEVKISDQTHVRRPSQDSVDKSKRNSVEITDQNNSRKNSDTVDHVLPRSSSRTSITRKPSQDSMEELKAQIPEHLEKEDVFLQNFEGKFKRNYSEELVDHQNRAESCINKYRRHFSEDLGSANKPSEDVSKYLRRNYSAESCETDETCSNDELNVENSSTIRVETLINALSIVNTKSETNLAEVVKDEPVKSLIKTVEQSLSTDIINKVDLEDQSRETSSEDEEGATADIWVRTIESPVKRKPPLGITETTSNTSNKENTASGISIVTDNVSTSTGNNDKPSQLLSAGTEEESKDTKSLAPRYTGTESLPCSRPGSRVASRSSSPAFFGTENKPKERMSAAEALGVVPKLPGPRLTQFAKSSAEIFRRQSLGNLADSKLGGAYGRSSWAPSAVLTDVEGSSTCDSNDYRRKKFSKRCASVEGSKTLARNARLNTSASYDSDSGRSVLDAKPSPYSYYHTLSRIGPNSRSSELDPKYFPKSTAIPPITGYSSLESYSENRSDAMKQRSLSQGSYRHPKSDTLPSGRPKSTCSCGHHLASSMRMENVSKRTYSVEELAGSRVGSSSGYSSDFGRSSSTSRSSFGKSQRVTFALDEDMPPVTNKKCELDKNGLPLKKIMKKPKTSPEFIDNFDNSNIFVDSHGVAHASHCSTLQHGHCNTLPHPATSHFSTLPQTSHCSTLPSSLQQVRQLPLIVVYSTCIDRIFNRKSFFFIE